MQHIPYRPVPLDPTEGLARGEALYENLEGRRSVRFFSDRAVPRQMIETAIRTASTAPSGAHMQPWTFVAISSAEVRIQIRRAAEAQEKISYEQRMSAEWLDALAPLGTDWNKPYLSTVPWIVILFAQRYGLGPDGEKTTHYYTMESCGIAAGMFITSLHEMGLSTLTHTPSPMGFLSEICQRPANEKPLILFPVGYAAEEATVPDLKRKSLDEVSVFLE